ncbi:MAG: hypothetical protein AAGK37_09150 [Pseudomonadota bacterium]
MKVLIVESDPELSRIWQRHLERQGATVRLATSQAEAVARLQKCDIQVIVLSLDLSVGSALAVADFASYRRPEARVVFVTRSGFFSDGSIFRLAPNTAAFVAAETPPEDLAAIVEHHGSHHPA